MNWKFFVTLVSLVVQFAFRLPWDHCEGRKDRREQERSGRPEQRSGSRCAGRPDRPEPRNTRKGNFMIDSLFFVSFVFFVV